MKALNFINQTIILLAVILGGYIYTTYYGFLGFGSAELEKLLAMPLIVAPILIITFIINLIINYKYKLTKTEKFFPLYAILYFLVPIIGGDAMDYFMRTQIFEYCMFIGNIVSLLLILWFIMIQIKRYKYMKL